MNNFDKNSEKSIVLEDLLKLKRHEKPDDAFWEKFDQQLHEKTLKKLVYRPSIFSRFSSLFTISFRPALTAGALALLTIVVQRPTFYSQATSIIVDNTPAHQTGFLSDFASVKRNYIKNSIIVESDDDCHYANTLISPSTSSTGVRYLAGNLASVSLGSTLSNTVY